MYIEIKELEKTLKENFEKKLLIKTKGLMDIELKIENIKVFTDRDNIWLINKNKINIGINKHQIIKITNDKENNMIKIKLDNLLDIYLIKV